MEINGSAEDDFSRQAHVTVQVQGDAHAPPFGAASSDPDHQADADPIAS